MLIEWMKPDFIYKNDSGCLRQLVHDGWKQVNVITSSPGSVRGGHCHKYNREGFYVAKGRFTLCVWDGQSRETYEMREGDMFLIPPGVFHTFDYQEETILVGLYDRGVELSGTEKDICDYSGQSTHALKRSQPVLNCDLNGLETRNNQSGQSEVVK